MDTQTNKAQDEKQPVVTLLVEGQEPTKSDIEKVADTIIPPPAQKLSKKERRALKKAKKEAKAEVVVKAEPTVEVKEETPVVAETKVEEPKVEEPKQAKAKVIPAKEQAPKVLMKHVDETAGEKAQYREIRSEFSAEEIVARNPYENQAASDAAMVKAFAKEIIKKVNEGGVLNSRQAFFVICAHLGDKAQNLTYDTLVDLINNDPTLSVIAHKSNVSSSTIARGNKKYVLDVQLQSHQAYTYLNSKHCKLQYMKATRVLNKRPHTANFGAEQSRIISYGMGDNFIEAMASEFEGSTLHDALIDAGHKAGIIINQ